MNKKLIFTLLFGASLLLSTNFVQAQNAESYESLMKKGNDKFSAKDYISAKTYYEMALKQKSNDPTAKKKLDETVKKIQEDGARQELFYAHLDAGDQYYGQQKYEEALSEYEAALDAASSTGTIRLTIYRSGVFYYVRIPVNST